MSSHSVQSQGCFAISPAESPIILLGNNGEVTGSDPAAFLRDVLMIYRLLSHPIEKFSTVTVCIGFQPQELKIPIGNKSHLG